MILLDTHVLIWLTEGEAKLGASARAMIEQELSDDEVAVSAMTFWEVAMLFDKNRIAVTRPLEDWVLAVAAGGFVIVAIDAGIAMQAGVLPGRIHGDPGDRIIVATARSLACPIVTADRKILNYAAAGHVKAIDARV